MSTGVVLGIAMALDAMLGEPAWLWRRVPHPAVLMGKLVGTLDTRMNAGNARLAKGVLAVGLMILIGAGLGWFLALLGPVAEIIIVATLLAQRSLVQHVSAVAAGLRLSLPQGRRAVAMIVSRDTTAMTEPGVARAAIESAAENLGDGVIAPAFWYLVGGLPGILIYKLINTADSMIGYRTPRHQAFGWASARLDDLLNWIPARLTALLIALPAGCLGAFPAIARDARLHKSPNAGWPEAAMAHATGIALAGPRSYHGTQREFPWVNATGRRTIGPPDIDTVIRHLWQAWGLLLALVLALYLIFT